MKWSEELNKTLVKTIIRVTRAVEPSSHLTREQQTPAVNDKKIIKLTREAKQSPPLVREQGTPKAVTFAERNNLQNRLIVQRALV